MRQDFNFVATFVSNYNYLWVLLRHATLVTLMRSPARTGRHNLAQYVGPRMDHSNKKEARQT